MSDDNPCKEILVDRERAMLRDFFDMPRNVHESILETLKGNNRIAVGDWFITYRGELCGCLMADDIETKAPDKFVNFRAKWRHLGRSMRLYDLTDLIEFYGLRSQNGHHLMNAAKSFDRWARQNNHIKLEQTFALTGILTEEGRARLIDLIEEHLAEAA